MLEGILSISGKGGLFKLVSQGKNVIIVESLTDGKRMPVSGTSRVSSLHEISMYTTGEDVSLAHVMANIFKLTGGKECISAKASNEELKEFMGKALPEWDADRIYVSDIKKLVTWYNLLLAHGLVSENEQDEEKGEKGEKEAEA
ncbi:MAG: DUF5606 domain-containing protein [Bacteroidales bacterium]|nr:DUF5606 domain-containing protein [Bacteroidales bacterium]MDD7725828.1 DUF5606 domain-containing protein [Bacteroidales bacterium]MDY4174705.1 DUF5606 domain-containing protein [Bacteroidales bacterium]